LDARDLEGLAEAVAREREITKRRVQQWISYMVLGSQLERTASERDGPRFTIKGGVALELRLSGKARATRDIDLIVEPGENDDLVSALRTALEGAYQDFTFRVKGETYRMPSGTVRVAVAVQYQGRAWNTVRVDLSPKEGHRLEVELVEPLDLSQFRLEPASSLPCLSVRYHLAHKMHGMTRPSTADHPNERVNDLIDVFLLRRLLPEGDQARVREACVEVFDIRAQHEWPPAFSPPDAWREEFEVRAAELGLVVARFDDAVEEVREYVREIDAGGA